MTNQTNNQSIIPSTDVMTTAQVVETLVTANNNSPVQDYVHPDDQTQPTLVVFKPVKACGVVCLRIRHFTVVCSEGKKTDTIFCKHPLVEAHLQNFFSLT